MDVLRVRKEIEIDAPPERVWPYVATQHGCRRWMCVVADQYDLVLEEREGGRYEERIVIKGRTVRSVGRVVVYDPPHRIVLSHRELESRTAPWPVDTAIAVIPVGRSRRPDAGRRGPSWI